MEATTIREAMLSALRKCPDFCCPLESLPYGKWSDGVVIAASLCLRGDLVIYPNGTMGLADRVPSAFAVCNRGGLNFAEVACN